MKEDVSSKDVELHDELEQQRCFTAALQAGFASEKAEMLESLTAGFEVQTSELRAQLVDQMSKQELQDKQLEELEEQRRHIERLEVWVGSLTQELAVERKRSQDLSLRLRASEDSAILAVAEVATHRQRAEDSLRSLRASEEELASCKHMLQSMQLQLREVTMAEADELSHIKHGHQVQHERLTLHAEHVEQRSRASDLQQAYHEVRQANALSEQLHGKLEQQQQREENLEAVLSMLANQTAGKLLQLEGHSAVYAAESLEWEKVFAASELAHELAEHNAQLGLHQRIAEKFDNGLQRQIDQADAPQCEAALIAEAREAAATARNLRQQLEERTCFLEPIQCFSCSKQPHGVLIQGRSSLEN
jgi:DNA repair exonuclease SbcCD ATPase subunit